MLLLRLLDLFTKGTRRHLWQRVGRLQRTAALHGYMQGACGHAACPHPNRGSWFHARFREPGRAYPCMEGCPLDKDTVRAGRVWAAWERHTRAATEDVEDTFRVQECES